MRILSGTYCGTRLRTPTRVFMGADDPVVRSDLLDRHRQADDLSVDVVAGASHWIPEERPDVVIATALDYFATPRPSIS